MRLLAYALRFTQPPRLTKTRARVGANRAFVCAQDTQPDHVESSIRRTSIPSTLILHQAAPPEKGGQEYCQQPYDW